MIVERNAETKQYFEKVQHKPLKISLKNKVLMKWNFAQPSVCLLFVDNYVTCLSSMQSAAGL